MRYKLKIILASILMALTTLQVFGETPADSVKVYFRVGHRLFDPAFGNNRKVMDSFVNEVSKENEENNISRIVVSGFASPDGTSNANERLAMLRCQTIADYISEHTGVERSFIETVPGGVAWEELRRMVEADQNVPSREKVLEILDNTPLWIFNAEGKIIDGRKAQLMSLSRGVPYRWMLEHLFPELRNAVAVSLFLREDKADGANRDDKADRANRDDKADGANRDDKADKADGEDRENKADGADRANRDENGVVLEEGGNPVVEEISETSNIANFEVDSDPLHRFALKSNMLYDAALLPNLEIEWRINEKWSVAIEGDVAWWRNKQKHKYYDLAMVSAEGRRWFAVKKPWHGFYAGVFAGGGKYDLENGGKGYYGEGAMAGVSAGYMFPISRCLSFEAGIGAGYMRTQYKEYIPVDGHYIYQRTKSLNYFGPLKLKFAIAWRFFDINKRKKAQ